MKIFVYVNLCIRPFTMLLVLAGLSEVIGGLGLADLHKLMGTVIQTAERQDIPAHVRDGYIMMYIFLPVVFKEDFKQYIGPILPSILQVSASYAWV